MLFPDDFTFVSVDSVKVVGNTRDDGDLFWPTLGGDAIDDERWEERVHLAWFVVEFDFPKELGVGDSGGRENVLVFLPVGALGIAAVSEPIGSSKEEAGEAQNEERSGFSRQIGDSA